MKCFSFNEDIFLNGTQESMDKLYFALLELRNVLFLDANANYRLTLLNLCSYFLPL